MPAPFDVFLVTPEREVWSGQATILVARGSEGELGIMNGHVPLLIELGIGPLFIQPADGERLAAAVDGGFLHVVTAEGETRVDVLAEHAELSTEIDVDRARRQEAEARSRIEAGDDGRALAELAKARVRLDLQP
jgi:F-type H+-transporting ATPase subunit epsilon